MKSLLTASQRNVILILLFFSSVYLLINNSHPFIGCKSEKSITKKDSIVPWKFPDISSIPENEEGKIIKLGRKIFIETYKYIGPDVKDTTKRYLVTNMDCQNCHFKGGTIKNVLGLVGVYTAYPALDPRSDKIISIQERINQCMTRSMNGKPIPESGEEMNALVEYMKWLSTDVPKGTFVEGHGISKIKLIDRGADFINGKAVYSKNCMTCHAENGYGVLNNPGNAAVASDSLNGYDFPPVMGPQSYNDGAGMYTLITSASFIYYKMPYNDAVLSIEDAYDVAAYINTAQRPEKANLDKDYPNLKLKPVDFPFPPFNDNFPAEQHKYGPYQQMLKEAEANK